MEYTTVQKYLEFCKVHKRLSPHSIRAYESDLQQYYKFGTSDVKSYITFLSKQIKKTSTLKRKIASLKSFYKYLEEEKLITDNPFHRLRLSYREEKSLPKIISRIDLKKVYHYACHQMQTAKTQYSEMKAMRNLLLISLLLSTGIRVSELCQLQLENIDLANRNILILGKGRKERQLYIGNTETFSLLQSFIATYCTNSTYLFTGMGNSNHLTEQSVRLMLKNISQTLNLQKYITPHMFRHSFATMLLDDGVDIRQIQHLLGHSTISVTQIYTQVSNSKQIEILSKHNPLSSIL